MKRSKIPSLFKDEVTKSLVLSNKNPKFSLLWLHGIADEPQSYLPFFAHKSSPLYKGCRIKIIQAPNRFVSINKIQSPAWYDLKKMNRVSEPQEQNINYSQVDNSFKLIEEEFNRQTNFWQSNQNNSNFNPNHRIYIGGMCQGASMALHYALTSTNVPAGVVSVNGNLLKYTQPTNLRKMPILLMHELKFLGIKQIQARQSYKKLLEDKFLVNYYILNQANQGLSLQYLQKMTQWLVESHDFLNKHYESQATT